jgi:hypothetical protein
MAVRIPLPCGREAIISEADRHLAAKPWRFSQGYVVCKEPVEDFLADGGKRYVVLRLHREVKGINGHIYFKDGNTLNCTRSNLTTEYTCRPGHKAGRPAGDPNNDGGWATKRAKEGQDRDG